MSSGLSLVSSMGLVVGSFCFRLWVCWFTELGFMVQGLGFRVWGLGFGV